jgi:UDP:flavonoid glycosyltransferase YjiC (YdhE family)
VRILVTFTGGTGHLLPLLPFARALRARGHDVLVTGQEAMRPVVEGAGFAFTPSGGATLADPGARGELLAVDRTREEEEVLGQGFAGRTARARVPRLLELVYGWQADVVLRDEVDFGAVVAAERAGIPHVSVTVLAAGGMLRPDVVAPSLDALRSEHGLAPDPSLDELDRHLTLVPVPPSFRDPEHPLPATAVHVQPAVLSAADPTRDDEASVALEWLARRQGGPLVHVTLGTVFHQESGDLFARVLAGLGHGDVDVVVTVGREIDPAELGPGPDHVHVARYLPQALLLSHCSLVVSHGGSGTVVNALTLGVPLVLLPMGADQPWNADRCEAMGVGVVLDPLTASTTDIGAAVGEVLGSPPYRHAAMLLREEALSLSNADEAAALVEQLF